MSKFKLTSILMKDKEGEMTIPIGPNLLLSSISSQLNNLTFNGVARIEYDPPRETMYPFIIARAPFEDGSSQYFLLIDTMQNKAIPVSMINTVSVYAKDNEISISHTYKDEIRKMNLHKKEVGAPENLNPIPILEEEDIREILEQTEEQNAFKILEYDEKMFTQ